MADGCVKGQGEDVDRAMRAALNFWAASEEAESQMAY